MPKQIAWAISAAVGIWLAWVFQGHIIASLGGKYDVQALGQWGDTFGALNALFATLGFGAALYTLFVQQRQLSKDRFDSTFWELTRLFIESRDKVVFQNTRDFTVSKASAADKIQMMMSPSVNLQKKSFTGISAFQAAWLEFNFWLKTSEPTEDHLILMYEKKIHNRSETTLGPYFRLLYTILYRIDTSKSLTTDEKVQYGNLIRGQLSQYEVAVIGLNGLSKVSKDFDVFVVRYKLLKYTTGFRRRLLQKYYPLSAFEGRTRPSGN